MGLIACFTDLHAHPFRAYASVLPGGQNSRLADALSCINQVREICVERGVDLVLFGGDMFHVRKNIPVQAFNAVYDAMARFTLDKIPVLAIHGNHDQADRLGADHSIYAFRSFLTVVDQPGWVTMKGRSGATYAVLAIPYTEDVDQLRKVVASKCPGGAQRRILLGHLGVQGAKVGADFVYANAADPTVGDLAVNSYDAGFLGHYHMHQQLGTNLWYVGAPLQHNWGDKGQKRGFALYDTDTGTFEHVELRAPKFIELQDDTWTSDEELEGNIIRVIAGPRNIFLDPDKRLELASRVNAISLEVVPKTEEAQPVLQRLVIDPSMARTDILRAYVESGLGPMGDLDEEYLLSVGAEILQEIGET